MDPSTDPLATMSVRGLCDQIAAEAFEQSATAETFGAVVAELERRCSSPTVGPVEVEAAWERIHKAQSNLLSRPGPDAGVPVGVRKAAEEIIEWNKNYEKNPAWMPCDKGETLIAEWIISLPPARGYDAGFAAGTDAERQRLVNWLRESDLPDEARYVEQGLHDGLTEHVVAPAADRDAEKCP